MLGEEGEAACREGKHMNWQSMGLAHLQPYQACFVVPPTSPAEKKYTKHPALTGREYDTASVMCESREERAALKKRLIRAYEKAQILRENKTVDLVAHGGQTKGQKAPR